MAKETSLCLVPNFPGKRWLKIALRCVHLVAFAGVFSLDANTVYWALLIFSGVGLFLIEALSNLLWFIQVRGLVIYFKFFLLWCLNQWPDYGLYWLVSIIAISGVISHAPGSLRYYSLYHRRKVTSLMDMKG